MNMKRTIIFRKLSAFLLVFLLVVSMFPAMMVSADAEASTVTVGEEVAVSAKELLSGLDLLGMPQTDLSATISRGDFAALLAGMMRYSGFSTPATGYRDVIEQSANAAAIGFVVEQGYMAGDKGLFRPFDPITYAEAVKALVEMTGNNIQKRITTDSAYMVKASGLGITKTISSKDGNAFLSAGAAYKLAANALTAKSIKMAAVEGGYVSEVETGNFLEVMHNIKRVSGVLTKTRYAGIYSTGGTGKNAVELDQIRFRALEDWTEYLGCQVYAYVDFGGDDAEILHMVPATDNAIIKLKAEDIISVNTAKTEIVYNLTNGEDDDESMTISNSTVVIWNGTYGGSVVNFSTKQLSLRSEEGFPKTGYVRLIDYDDDNVCDSMIIMSYEIYYTASADERKEWITDANRTENKVFDISVFNDSNRFITYESGTEADIELLDKEQLVHVAAGINNQLLFMIISETQVEATISQIRERNGIKEYYSDGVWYVGNDYFNKYYTSGADQIYVGWHGYFNLDLDGRIATVEADSESYWGYLVAISQGTGLSPERQMKIFSNYETDQDAYEVQILELAAKVQLDAGGYVQTCKAEDLRSCSVFKRSTSDPTFNAANGGFNDQLIRYTVNPEGKVNSIKTAYTDGRWGFDDFNSPTTPSGSENKSISQEWFVENTDFNLCYDASKDYTDAEMLAAIDDDKQNHSGKGVAYKHLTLSAPNPYNTELIFADFVSLNEDDVPVWVIPSDLNDNESYNHCTWSTYGGIKFNFKIYDLKGNGEASAIVWRQPDGAAMSYDYADHQKLFVTETKKVMNEEGAIATEVTGYRNTRYSSEKMGKITLKSEDANMFNDVEVGDLIDYAVDSNQNVISIRFMFRYKYFVQNGHVGSSDYKWQHVDKGTDPTKNEPFSYDYAHSDAEENYKDTHWIRSVRLEGAECQVVQASSNGHGAPYWGKILYDNTMGVTLTFDNPYETSPDGNPTIKEDYGNNHDTFAKTNYFQWIVHDTKTGETWLETSPAVYSVLDVGIDNVENATDALVFGTCEGINMGALYLK